MNATGTSRKLALVALVLLVPAASIGTWAGMDGGAGTSWGKAVYAAMKVWLLGMPIAWLVLVERTRPRWPKLRSDGMWAGLITGVAIFVVMLGGYWFIGRTWIDPTIVRDKVAAIGLDTPLRFWAMGAYITFVNALLEEYVWRWFVGSKCEQLLRRRWPAVLLAAACFTAHHVIVLYMYFDWPIILVGSVGVFIGGATWSMLYIRYRNIYSPYLSHIFPDIAIFVIGWHMITSA